MGLLEDNNRKIGDAFAKAMLNVDTSVRRGLEALLEWGVNECLAKHDDSHQRHLESGDTYAWVLFRNGVEVGKKTFTQGKESVGLVERSIDYVRGKITGAGWEGFVIAGLKTTKDTDSATYFNVLYEFYPMRAAISELKHQDFDKYFHKV